MNAIKRILFSILVLTLAMLACGQGTSIAEPLASSDYTSSDLFVVVGQSSAKFAGNGNGDGLLLDQYRTQSGVGLRVEIVDDRKSDEYRNMMLNGQPGAPDVLICDDSLGCDGLQSVKLIASHKVGAAIREDVANQLGLNTNTIPFTTFIGGMESGTLKTTASNALAGYAPLEFFFSTMAWCSQTDTASLTAEIVKRQDVRECGQRVYDFISSTNGGQEALDIVYNNATTPDSYNTVITYDSELLGPNGLNTKLQNEGKPVFKFFYFEEATALANIGIGTRKFGDGDNRSGSADKLLRFFYDREQGDASQKFINLNGFTEGSAGLFYHYDDAFNPNWGVASSPVGVQVVNSPVPPVAAMGKDVYRDLYKRPKVIKACMDVSPSMLQDWMNIQINNETVSVFRIQALNRATLKFTDPKWLSDSGVTPGLGDEIEYYFFSTQTSDLVVKTIGPDTAPAGQKIDSLIGPWNEKGPNNWSQYDVQDRLAQQLSFESSGTEMFDCAAAMLKQIKNNYNPKVDYIIVILTDGENSDQDGHTKGYELYENWKAFGEKVGQYNIKVVGIAFGTDGASINSGYTAQFNGKTIKGDNDQELIDAFKFILGN